MTAKVHYDASRADVCPCDVSALCTLKSGIPHSETTTGSVWSQTEACYFLLTRRRKEPCLCIGGYPLPGITPFTGETDDDDYRPALPSACSWSARAEEWEQDEITSRRATVARG